jgi:hypothetical protein
MFLQLLPLPKEKIVGDSKRWGSSMSYGEAGTKKTFDGKHRDEARAIQMRYTYCGARNERAKTPGRSPLTA